jgi:protein-arginine kinase activator protein McsA
LLMEKSKVFERYGTCMSCKMTFKLEDLRSGAYCSKCYKERNKKI